MNFNRVPTLQHIALVKTASILWVQDAMTSSYEILDMKPTVTSAHRLTRQMLEHKISSKVYKLHLTGSLIRKLINIIKPVGLELAIWKNSFKTFLTDMGLVRASLQKICWTPLGTVDKRRTAEFLVKEESLDIVKRYELACIYCLKSDVHALYNRVSENKLKSYYNVTYKNFNQEVLVVFWSCELSGGMGKLYSLMLKGLQRLRTPSQFAFEYAAMGGNKTATRYFLQKLAFPLTKESLVFASCLAARCRCSSEACQIEYPEEYSSVLHFLLSEMDPPLLKKVLKIASYAVLRCFLDWPLQGFFLELANQSWKYLNTEAFASLLYVIIHEKITMGYKDVDYQKLLRDFWQDAPLEHKKHIIVMCLDKDEWSILIDLFKIEDRESIFLILKEATLAEREYIAALKTHWKILVSEERWDLLRFFLLQCISSKSRMEEYRDLIKGQFFSGPDKIEGKLYVFTKFFRLIDELIETWGEEIGSRPAKRLCVTWS